MICNSVPVNCSRENPQTIRFEITEDQLKFYNKQLQWTAEPGDFNLFIGGNSSDVFYL
jgi:beta-glucosidase